ncbi:PTS transporter subunit EIIC [Spiroplasma endosymbiont of Lasioglossum malachurum]|uniref:PTS transporter subunit EIIC n=1 Tax=Spiroplasma endosymbiont of Lasioglossum malachurum TaxID=3066319 RepID=UPI0030CA990E
MEGSGFFQSGFFPIMMGGIPAAALAMIMAAKKENRKMVSGFLGGVALVSFISGITLNQLNFHLYLLLHYY